MDSNLSIVVLGENDSKKIAALGFVCACMIVIIHASPRVVSSTFARWIIGLVGADGVCRIAVPYFFLVSGFLLAGRFSDKGWYCTAVRKRVRSIVLPYAIWIIWGMIVQHLACKGAAVMGCKIGISDPLSVFKASALGLDPFHNVGYLWYLRDLFFLVLASPLFYSALRKYPIAYPAVAFAIYFCYSLAGLEGGRWYDFFEYFISLRGIAYFILGMSIRLSNIAWQCLANMRRSLIMLLLGGILILCKLRYLMVGNISVSNGFDCLAVPCLLWGIWALSKYIPVGSRLACFSFHIYLFHPTFLLLSIAVITILGLRFHLDHSLVLSFLRVIFAISMSLIVAKVIKTCSPVMYKIVFGGR